jgi:hypothetical protein
MTNVVAAVAYEGDHRYAVTERQLHEPGPALEVDAVALRPRAHGGGVTTGIHDQRQSRVEEPGRVSSAGGHSTDPARELADSRDREEDVVCHRIQRRLGPAFGYPPSHQRPVVRDVHEPGVVAHQHARAVRGDVLEVPHLRVEPRQESVQHWHQTRHERRIALEEPFVQRAIHPFTDGLEHGEPMMLVGVVMTFSFKGVAGLGRLAERDSSFGRVVVPRH